MRGTKAKSRTDGTLVLNNITWIATINFKLRHGLTKEKLRQCELDFDGLDRGDIGFFNNLEYKMGGVQVEQENGEFYDQLFNVGAPLGPPSLANASASGQNGGRCALLLRQH